MNPGKSIKNLRRQYTLNTLSEKTVQKNPFRQFEKWFNEILKSGIVEPNAMILSTADKNGNPSVRVVLLKGINKTGFKFFTNYRSRKGKELSENDSASILFFWAEQERQVRVEGKIKKLSKTESQKYFNTRPVQSRIAAWASDQSYIIPDREFLELRYKSFEKKFSRKKIPLPPKWGGYILVPDYFEFWQGRENRLHDRICYRKVNARWKIFRLAP